MGTSLGMMLNDKETCEDEVESRIGLTCRTIEALRKKVKKAIKFRVCRMCFNFCGVYISQIFHIHGFNVFKFADAGHCSMHIH